MEQNGSAPSTPQRREHRSIFADYWKTDPRPDSPLSRLPSSPKHLMEEVKPLSPTRRRIIHNTYTYDYDKNANPFRFFGIEEDESRLTSTDVSTDDEDDCNSLNSYERHLQKNELGVASEGKHPKRSLTSPSLFRSMATMNLESSRRKTQSDTALFVETKKKPSCLRKSRFSFDSDSIDSNTSNRGVSNNNGTTNGERRSSVSFEPMIKVHEFQDPVEKWAPNGWSNWFGTWQ